MATFRVKLRGSGDRDRSVRSVPSLLQLTTCPATVEGFYATVAKHVNEDGYFLVNIASGGALIASLSQVQALFQKRKKENSRVKLLDDSTKISFVVNKW